LEPLYTFQNHTGEVTGFFVLPQSAPSRLRGCVCSVGSDNSIAVLSLEEMKPYV